MQRCILRVESITGYILDYFTPKLHIFLGEGIPSLNVFPYVLSSNQRIRVRIGFKLLCVRTDKINLDEKLGKIHLEIQFLKTTLMAHLSD
jgi:hypothetical protein